MTYTDEELKVALEDAWGNLEVPAHPKTLKVLRAYLDKFEEERAFLKAAREKKRLALTVHSPNAEKGQLD